jgi:hypothetical protein
MAVVAAVATVRRVPSAAMSAPVKHARPTAARVNAETTVAAVAAAAVWMMALVRRVCAPPQSIVLATTAYSPTLESKELTSKEFLALLLRALARKSLLHNYWDTSLSQGILILFVSVLARLLRPLESRMLLWVFCIPYMRVHPRPKDMEFLEEAEPFQQQIDKQSISG